MAEKPASVETAEPDSYEALFEGPAVYANRCFVSMGPVVRITFMEQYQRASGVMGPIQFRAAVALDLAQAVALSNIMRNLLSDVEKQIKEAEEQLNIQLSKSPGQAPDRNG